MSVIISDETLDAVKMTGDELLREVALYLYQSERFTLEQASRFLGVSRLEFQHLLASRNIYIHYGIEEAEEDLQTLKKLGHLCATDQK